MDGSATLKLSGQCALISFIHSMDEEGAVPTVASLPRRTNRQMLGLGVFRDLTAK